MPAFLPPAAAPRTDKGEGDSTWRGPGRSLCGEGERDRGLGDGGRSRPPQGPRGKGAGHLLAGPGSRALPPLASHLLAGRLGPSLRLRLPLRRWNFKRRLPFRARCGRLAAPEGRRRRGRVRPRQSRGAPRTLHNRRRTARVCVCGRRSLSRRAEAGGRGAGLFTRRSDPTPPPDAGAGPCAAGPQPRDVRKASPPHPAGGRWYGPTRRLPLPSKGGRGPPL